MFDKCFEAATSSALTNDLDPERQGERSVARFVRSLGSSDEVLCVLHGR